MKLDIKLWAIGDLELKLVGRKFGETIEAIKLFGILEIGFEHPQEKTGDVISSLTIGEEAIWVANSEPSLVFLRRLQTIINCIVFTRFWQTDGVQSVMMVVGFGYVRVVG